MLPLPAGPSRAFRTNHPALFDLEEKPQYSPKYFTFTFHFRISPDSFGWLFWERGESHHHLPIAVGTSSGSLGAPKSSLITFQKIQNPTKPNKTRQNPIKTREKRGWVGCLVCQWCCTSALSTSAQGKCAASQLVQPWPPFSQPGGLFFCLFAALLKNQNPPAGNSLLPSQIQQPGWTREMGKSHCLHPWYKMVI